MKQVWFVSLACILALFLTVRFSRTVAPISRTVVPTAANVAPIATPTPQVPFRLKIDKIQFKPAEANLVRQGYTHEVWIDIGHRGAAPAWWGDEKKGKWLVDVALVYPQDKSYRRLRLDSGWTVPAGSMPYFDSMHDVYTVVFDLAAVDLKDKIGKVVFKADFAINKQLTGVRFSTMSDAKYQNVRRKAVASVPLWAVVPRLEIKK